MELTAQAVEKEVLIRTTSVRHLIPIKWIALVSELPKVSGLALRV